MVVCDHTCATYKYHCGEMYVCEIAVVAVQWRF